MVGSLKLQVSFAEYSLFDRVHLHKRPIILRSLLVVATPYGLVSMSLLQKEPDKRDYILQERPIILRSLLVVATPYGLVSMSHIT